MPKQICCQFDDALDQRLRIFMSASGNSMVAVIRRAVTNHIDNELHANRGLRLRFEQHEALVAAGIPQPRSKRRPRKKASGDTTEKSTESV